MKNGVYITNKTEGCIQSVFVDEEVLEFARNNQKVQNRLNARDAKERMEAAEAAAQSRKEYLRQRKNRRLLRQEAALAAVSIAATAASYLGLLAPLLGTIISVSCLGAICFKAGRWHR